jgi:hypothetical protein
VAPAASGAPIGLVLNAEFFVDEVEDLVVAGSGLVVSALLGLVAASLPARLDVLAAIGPE